MLLATKLDHSIDGQTRFVATVYVMSLSSVKALAAGPIVDFLEKEYLTNSYLESLKQWLHVQ